MATVAQESVDAATAAYDDPLLHLDGQTLTIRRHYFPLATTKRIPLDQIQSASEFPLTALSGRFRIWGSHTLFSWSNLDPARPRKRRGFALHTSRPVLPVVTPDDPDGFRYALARRGIRVGWAPEFRLLVQQHTTPVGRARKRAA